MYFLLMLLTVVHANRWDDFGKDLLILLLMLRMVKSFPKSGIFAKVLLYLFFERGAFLKKILIDTGSIKN